MMSAIKSGHITYSRFARMAELEEEHQTKLKQKITVERSGGGLWPVQTGKLDNSSLLFLVKNPKIETVQY